MRQSPDPLGATAPSPSLAGDADPGAAAAADGAKGAGSFRRAGRTREAERSELRPASERPGTGRAPCAPGGGCTALGEPWQRLLLVYYYSVLFSFCFYIFFLVLYFINALSG